MDASTRWLALIGGVIAVAVIASVVVLTRARGEKEFPPGSPEATVQRYLRAVADRDATTALSLFAPDVEQRCGTFPREAITSRGDATFRATLEQTVTRDSVVEVRVRLAEMHGAPPFAGSESTQSLVFELERTGSDWRFSQPPWPLFCPRGPLPASTPTPPRTPSPSPVRTPSPSTTPAAR